MTLPNERYRSLQQAREFLRSLLDPKQTPRVPKAVRREAYRALRHYPNQYEIELMATKIPLMINKDSK